MSRVDGDETREVGWDAVWTTVRTSAFIWVRWEPLWVLGEENNRIWPVIAKDHPGCQVENIVWGGGQEMKRRDQLKGTTVDTTRKTSGRRYYGSTQRVLFISQWTKAKSAIGDLSILQPGCSSCRLTETLSPPMHSPLGCHFLTTHVTTKMVWFLHPFHVKGPYVTYLWIPIACHTGLSFVDWVESGLVFSWAGMPPA